MVSKNTLQRSDFSFLLTNRTFTHTLLIIANPKRSHCFPRKPDVVLVVIVIQKYAERCSTGGEASVQKYGRSSVPFLQRFVTLLLLLLETVLIFIGLLFCQKQLAQTPTPAEALACKTKTETFLHYLNWENMSNCLPDVTYLRAFSIAFRAAGL